MGAGALVVEAEVVLSWDGGLLGADPGFAGRGCCRGVEGAGSDRGVDTDGASAVVEAEVVIGAATISSVSFSFSSFTFCAAAAFAFARACAVRSACFRSCFFLRSILESSRLIFFTKSLMLPDLHEKRLASRAQQT